MRVLIDVDGVLRNSIPSIIDIYKKFDKEFPYTEKTLPEFDTFELFSKCNFHKDICIDYAQDIFFKSPNYIDEVENLKFLIDEFPDIEFVICSNQQPANIHLTDAWLDKLNIGIERIYTKDKHLVEAEILVDDCPSNLIKFSKKGKSICLRRPWNESYKSTKINTLSELQYLLL
jgi:5'(3')-deoxyribonucleotidase